MVETSLQYNGLKQRFHQQLYLNVQRVRGRPVGPLMQRLQAWQRLKPEELEQIARVYLRDLLSHARANVPHYRSGKWAQLNFEKDIHRLESWPVLEKGEVYAAPHDLVAHTRVGRVIQRHSSGSSGRSVATTWDSQAIAWNWANEYLALGWFGIPIGVPALLFWGFSSRVADLVLNRKFICSKRLTPIELEAAARYLIRRRSVLLWGLPSAFTHLARYIDQVYPGARKPLAAFAKLGGEELYPFQRMEIEQHLGARPINTYGGSEVGAIAAECPHGRLHIFSTNVWVEALHGDRPALPGEVGDLVVTNLHNRAMPLIRYRLGDRGAISHDPCSCGLPGPLLVELRPRASDRLACVDGQEIHASALVQALGESISGGVLDHFTQIQFQQIDRMHWKVQLEGGRQEQALLEHKFSELVWDTFGAGSRVDLEYVDFIPRESSGKYRYYRTGGLNSSAG